MNLTRKIISYKFCIHYVVHHEIDIDLEKRRKKKRQNHKKRVAFDSKYYPAKTCEVMTSRLNIAEFNRPRVHSVGRKYTHYTLQVMWKKTRNIFQNDRRRTYKKKKKKKTEVELFNDCASNGPKTYLSFALPCFAEKYQQTLTMRRFNEIGNNNEITSNRVWG